MDALLAEHGDGTLFVSGCVDNQGKFYPRFDSVVLLSAPEDVILGATRDTNEYGGTEQERELIAHHLATVEPLLRAGATAEIDTRAPLDEVVDALERIAAYELRRALTRRPGWLGDALGEDPHLALGIGRREAAISGRRQLELARVGAGVRRAAVERIDVVDEDVDQRRRAHAERPRALELVPGLADHDEAVLAEEQLRVHAAGSSDL